MSQIYYGLTSQTYDFTKTVSNQTSYAISGLERGRTYYFTVTAYNASGNESGFSNEVSVTVPPTVTEIPVLAHEPLTRGRETEFRVTGVNSETSSPFFSAPLVRVMALADPSSVGCVWISDPSVFGEATADASGTATLSRTIPVDTPVGRTISIQAVIQRDLMGQTLSRPMRSRPR